MACAVTTTTLLVLLIGWNLHGSHVVDAFSQGAPEFACQTMEPTGHQAPEMHTPAPYTVLVSAKEVTPSGTVKVTVKGTNGAKFKGVMASVYSQDFPVGVLKVSDNKTKLICKGMSITHTSPDNKSEVTFDWEAPKQLFEGARIEMRVTVVQVLKTYWTHVINKTLLFTLPEEEITVPPATTSTSKAVTKSAATSVTAKPSSKFPGELLVDPECGQSKACFHDCQQGRCSFVVSWQKGVSNSDHITISMRYRLPDANQHWIAVGFSDDQHMGDDSVTECLMDNGQIKVLQSFNDGLFNKYLGDRKAGLSEQRGSVDDGILTCSFTRKKTYPDDPRVFDLSKDYFLMVATGEAISGNKLPHTFDVLPDVSPSKLNLLDIKTVSAQEPPASILIQIHSALMMLSWLLLTSIAVSIAKYGKSMFPKLNPCGVNIWFQVHRGCMVLVLLLTIIGVILMVVECQGYCQIPQGSGMAHWPLHPVLGFLVLLLTIVNPIMALFRPEVNAPSRYLFTWSHWGVGVLAWILAALAMFIGLDLKRAHAPAEAMYIMVIYGVYHVVFLVAMETLPRPLRKLYNFAAEKTLKRGKMYNLERAHSDNLGFEGEDGNTEDCAENGEEAYKQWKQEKAHKKELTREELKLQRLMLLAHFCFVTILTFAMLLMVYFYSPGH